MDQLRETMEWVKTEYIDKILEFFEQGTFTKPSNEDFIQVTSKVFQVLRISSLQLSAYDFYYHIIYDYVAGHVFKELNQLSGRILLKELVRRWENHKILTFWLSKTFAVLDRGSLSSIIMNSQTHDAPYMNSERYLTLCELALHIFKTEIYEKLKQNIIKAIFFELKNEREGIEIDETILKNSIKIILSYMSLVNTSISKKRENNCDSLYISGVQEIDIYEIDFEPLYLDSTSETYRNLSRGWLQDMSCPEYLREVKKTFDFEESRMVKYLKPSSKAHIMKRLTQELITAHAQTVSDMEGTGCSEMLRQEKFDELRLMFTLFKKDEQCLQNITNKLKPYIELNGTEIITDQNNCTDANTFTTKLLEFKSQIDGLLAFAFDSMSLFQRCRDLAFKQFLNQNRSSAANIASYCDHQMKKGLRGVAESEIENRLEATIGLFVCLEDRDVFLKYYTRFLSKRLLENTSVSEDAEKSMIRKLTIECGQHITHKMTKMNEDISLSVSISNEFKELSHRGLPYNISLEVKVLTQSAWPRRDDDDVCKVPQDLMNPFIAYRDFYVHRHSGRRLDLLTGEGQVEIGAIGFRKPYTFVMSTCQASLLLMFDCEEALDLQALCTRTKMNKKLAKDMIINFFNPKTKLLNKQSRGKTLSDTDQFSVNSEFQSPSLRVDFRTVQQSKKKDAENDQIAVKEERKFVIDSVIVRIAKARKIIDHNELIPEVVKQIQMFKPQPLDIKKQIDFLIEREFLRRDDDKRGLYHYIP